MLFLAALPELSAYQELRAGFTAAVSHELRTPLARLLVLLESATLPGADVDELVEQARQEIQQTRDLIDDVLFLGELETGREVVSLGRTRALPVVEEVASAFADRAEHAEVHAHGQRRRRRSSCRCGRACCASSSRTSSRTRSATPAPAARARILVTQRGRRAAARRLRRRHRRARDRSAAPVRALLPRRPGAVVARHRPRPRDREARRHLGRRARWRRTARPDGASRSSAGSLPTSVETRRRSAASNCRCRPRGRRAIVDLRSTITSEEARDELLRVREEATTASRPSASASTAASGSASTISSRPATTASAARLRLPARDPRVKPLRGVPPGSPPRPPPHRRRLRDLAVPQPRADEQTRSSRCSRRRSATRPASGSCGCCSRATPATAASSSTSSRSRRRPSRST